MRVAIAFGILGLMVAPMLLNVSFVAFLYTAIFLFGIALIFLGIAHWEGKRNLEKFELEQAGSNLTMARWSALCYCRHCDHVYNPHTHQTAPRARMRSLL